MRKLPPINAEDAPAAMLEMFNDLVEGPYTEVLQNEILPNTRQGIRDNFTSSATPDNSDWPARKPRKGDDGHPLLMDTGALLQAAVGTGSGTLLEVGTHELTVGIDGQVIPYANRQNVGDETINLPSREYEGLRDERIDENAEHLADFTLEEIFGES